MATKCTCNIKDRATGEVYEIKDGKARAAATAAQEAAAAASSLANTAMENARAAGNAANEVFGLAAGANNTAIEAKNIADEARNTASDAYDMAQQALNAGGSGGGGSSGGDSSLSVICFTNEADFFPDGVIKDGLYTDYFPKDSEGNIIGGVLYLVYGFSRDGYNHDITIPVFSTVLTAYEYAGGRVDVYENTFGDTEIRIYLEYDDADRAYRVFVYGPTDAYCDAFFVPFGAVHN